MASNAPGDAPTFTLVLAVKTPSPKTQFKALDAAASSEGASEDAAESAPEAAAIRLLALFCALREARARSAPEAAVAYRHSVRLRCGRVAKIREASHEGKGVHGFEDDFNPCTATAAYDA